MNATLGDIGGVIGTGDGRQSHRAAARPPRLSALEAFEAAARLGSFSAAAAEMNLTPGAVSRQIAALEGDLGVALFLRDPRGVRLTGAGQRLRAAAAQALAGVVAAAMELRTASAGGVVRISVSPAFGARWLRPRLPGFRAVYRRVRVAFVSESRRLDQRRGGFDLAVREAAGAAAEGAESVAWLREELVPVAAPALLRDRRRAPEMLAGLPWLHAGSDRGWRAWLSAAGLPGLAPPAGLMLEDEESAIAAALAGRGVLIGRTALIEEELREGRLVEAVPLRVPSPQPYHLVRPAGTEGFPASALWDWMLRQASDACPRGRRLPTAVAAGGPLRADAPHGFASAPEVGDAR